MRRTRVIALASGILVVMGGLDGGASHLFGWPGIWRLWQKGTATNLVLLAGFAAIVYVIATGLAMLLTDQKINPFSGLPRLGIPFYNELVLGGDIGHVTGDPDQDRLFTVLARGGLIFLATGIIPLLAEAAHNSLFNGRVKPFVLCWILAALAPLAYVLVKGHW